MPAFYLASTEGYDLEMPRKCYLLRRLKSLNRDDLLLIKIEPPLIGQKFGLGGQDIHQVIIANRHKIGIVFPITYWPVYVYIARPLISLSDRDTEIQTTDMEVIAWGELYKTEKDAQNKNVEY